jgi:hypothetical protein
LSPDQQYPDSCHLQQKPKKRKETHKPESSPKSFSLPYSFDWLLRPNLFDRSNPGLNGFQDTEKSVACHKKVTGNGSDQMDLNSSISFMDLMLAR